MKNKSLNTLLVAQVFAVALTLFLAAPQSFARNGKDDPAGHHAGDDRVARKVAVNHKLDDHGRHRPGHK